MDTNSIVSAIQSFFSVHQAALHALKIVGVIVLSWLTLVVTKRYILRGFNSFIKGTKTQLDDILLRSKIFQRLAYIPPAIIISNFAYLFVGFEMLIKRVMTAVIVVVITMSVSAFLSALQDFLSRRDQELSVQFKSYLQITRIVLYLVGTVIIVAALIGQSPTVLLSGIGALTAVLLLIFRDTILSFVASLQIASYDLVKVGDWIEIPKYNADGDVIDIALHTVKVQNWDKTITVIPTHKLIEESFKNWRGMQMSGGRRIKRAIHIDQNSVRFCDREMLDKFERITLIRDYIRKQREEVRLYNEEKNIAPDDPISGRCMTNLGTFRAYLQAYLHNHPKVHPDLTFLIRQLTPGPQGIPMEIYVFAADTNWVNYEAIQADIFDHIIASLPLFDLKVFQLPTGKDLRGNLQDKLI